MPDEVRRTSRNYANALLAPGADATPGARIWRDVQLVQLIDDFRELVIPIPPPAVAVTAVTGVAPAARFPAIRLTAPARKACVVLVGTNQDGNGPPGNDQFVGIGTGLPALANVGTPTTLSWGFEQFQATIETGDVSPPAVPGNTFTLPFDVTFDAQAVVLNPGESLQISSGVPATDTQAFLTWREVG
jgi:hypothetical protein